MANKWNWHELLWHRWKQRQLCSVYQDKIVDSEEHVSTSKAVVDAWVEEWNQVDGSPGEPLYKTMPLYYHAALPAPVVPDEMYWQDAPVEGSSKAAAYATGWNACRAAMLHGKGE